MRLSLRPPWPIHTTLLQWHPRAPQSIPRRIATTSSSNPAPIDIPKLILSPGSSHHNSLPSFLRYTERSKLNVKTTYYVGTHYEYTAAISLMRLGFSLLRVGGSNDAGIDLIGHWALAPLREPMRIIIQCKARTNSVTPAEIREMEGSFNGTPPDWKNKDVLALMVTMNKATKGALEALGRCRSPMGFVMVSRAGTIKQFVWNRAASERGLEGVGVTVRHTPRVLLSSMQRANEADTEASTATKKSTAKFETAGTNRDIQLTWLGSPIFAERDTLDKDTLGLMNMIQENGEVTETRLQKQAIQKLRTGKQRTAHKLPVPCGGMVTKGGKEPIRPAKIKAFIVDPKRSETKRKPGRPKILKDETQHKLGRPLGLKDQTKRKPGRPAGSKDKQPRTRRSRDSKIEKPDDETPEGSKYTPTAVVDAG